MGTSSTLVSHGGVVSAGDIQTAQAGAFALQAGGNAVDAVVAAGFAAFVCEVALCGPLGGGVMVARLPEHGELAVDFFGRTPGLGGPKPKDLEFGEASIDFGVATQSFRVGRGAAALGLALPGLLEFHQRWGRLPLPLVAEPAVRLGREGFEVGPPMAYILKLISSIFAYTPESEALCLKDGRLPAAGERLFNSALGDVLEAVAANPRVLNDLLGDFALEFGPSKGGLVTERDIREMELSYLDPVKVKMRDWTMTTMPAPSSGGCLIALGLRLLEGIRERAEFLSADHLIEVALTQRLLLEVRTPEFDEQIHDSAFVRELLSDRKLLELRDCLGRPAAVHPDNPLGSTTQISVIDSEGGVIGMTLTNGEGCGRVLPGTGIQINNLLGEADINPRGFHTDPPGTHMATMMAPTIATHPGGDIAALGSGGSNRLRNAIMMTLCNLIEYGASPLDAVLAPRLHLEAAQDGFELNIEDADQQAGVLDQLREVFPRSTLFPGRNMFFGGVHSAFVLDGNVYGVGDPRRGGQSVLL